jgi:hypothetical protein
MLCDVSFIALFSVVLVKSFTVTFLLRRERLKSLSLVPQGTGLGSKPWDQLQVNRFVHASRHILRLMIFSFKKKKKN